MLLTLIFLLVVRLMLSLFYRYQDAKSKRSAVGGGQIQEESERTPLLSRAQSPGDAALDDTGPKPSLIKAMVKAFGPPFLAAGLLKLMNDILAFVNPQILK